MQSPWPDNKAAMLILTLSRRQINVTAITLGQGHGMVIQHMSPDPYIRCGKYL